MYRAYRPIILPLQFEIIYISSARKSSEKLQCYMYIIGSRDSAVGIAAC
jgi:hypothetical protein